MECRCRILVLNHIFFLVLPENYKFTIAMTCLKLIFDNCNSDVLCHVVFMFFLIVYIIIFYALILQKVPKQCMYLCMNYITRT